MKRPKLENVDTYWPGDPGTRRLVAWEAFTWTVWYDWLEQASKQLPGPSWKVMSPPPMSQVRTALSS